MLKRLLYAGMILLLGMFVYNTYIKTREAPPMILRENIETQNIIYKIGKDTKIEAKTLIEDKKEDNTYFQRAIAFFNDMKISGKEALVDKYKNMTISGNILGETPDGWKFYTDEIKYDEGKGRFNSKTKVRAVNEEKGVTIEADKLEANKDFTIIVLDNNVKLLSDTISLKCMKATYDRRKEIIKLNDNINFVGKNLDTKKGKVQKITGKFNAAIYEMKTKKLNAWGKFKVYYLGYVLSSTNLVYFNETGDFHIYDNVDINSGDLYMNVKKISYYKKKEKMNLIGPITGTKGEIEFKADSGEIETENEKFKAIGNIEVTRKDAKLLADQLVFDQAKNIAYLYGENKTENVIITTNDYEIETLEMQYDTLKDKLYLPHIVKGKRDNVDFRGERLAYNNATKNGKVYKVNARKLKDDIVAEELNFDLNKQEYILEKNIVFSHEGSVLKSEHAFMDEKNNTIFIKDKAVFENVEKDIVAEGYGTYYDNTNQVLVVEKDVKVNKGQYELTGEKLTYKLKTDEGEIKENVKIINKNLELTGYGDKAEYVGEKKIVLTGNVRILKDEYLIRTKEAFYDVPQKKVYFNDRGILTNDMDNLKAETDKGYFDISENIFYGEKFKGFRDEVYFKSNYINYNYNTYAFTMKEEAEIVRDTMTINSEELVYYQETEEVKAEQKITIKEQGMLTVAEKGEINLREKTVKALKVETTTDQGDKLVGDYLDGFLYKREFNFKGNLIGDLSDGTKFSGELAKMYFLPLRENPSKFGLTRGEIKNNAQFIYRDMQLDSEFLEFDNEEKLVFGKGTSVLKLDNETDISADYIYLDSAKQIGWMENNVSITSISKEIGTINTRSDRAALDNKNKIVELEGNVKSYQGETIVEADKGIYDIKEKKMSGKGDIKLTYLIESDDEKAKKKEEEEKREKEEKEKEEKLIMLKQARESLEIETQYTINDEKLELPENIYQVNINWESDDESVITNNGEIIKENVKEIEQNIKMTAKMQFDMLTTTKAFTVVIVSDEGIKEVEEDKNEKEIGNKEEVEDLKQKEETKDVESVKIEDMKTEDIKEANVKEVKSVKVEEEKSGI